MRIIKFRAWRKIKRKMQNIIRLDLEDKEAIFEEHYEYDDEIIDWEHFRDIELLQFTGLKDKKGVEIYEEDIIYSERTGSIEIIKAFDGFCKCYEYWHVIIGNIYETPELLGEK